MNNRFQFLIKPLGFILLGVVIGYQLSPIDDNQPDDNKQGSFNTSPNQAFTENKSINQYNIRDSHSSPKNNSLSHLIAQIESRSISATLADQILDYDPPEHQYLMLQMLLEKWGQEDPTEALNYLSSLDDTYSDAEFLEPVLRNINEANFNQTLEWLENNKNSLHSHDYLIATAYAGLAKSNPEFAINSASFLEDSALKSRIIQSVVNEWAKTDARQVFAWIENAPLNASLRDHYASTMVHFIEQDSNNAREIIQSMEPSSLKTSLAGQYARKTVQDDLNHALEWSLALEDPEARKQALQITFDAWANNDIENALDYALQLPEDDNSRNDILHQTAIHLSRLDPTKATQSIERFPDHLQPQIAQNIALAFAEVDQESTKSWIQTIPPGPTRDNAIKGALYELRSRDPQAAFELSGSVQSKPLSFQLLHEAASSWYQTDPQSTEHAVSNSDQLSDQQKYTILSDLLESEEPINILLPSR